MQFSQECNMKKVCAESAYSISFFDLGFAKLVFSPRSWVLLRLFRSPQEVDLFIQKTQHYGNSSAHFDP